MKKRILVTAASGYVGGRLLRRLEERGLLVRCLARRPEFLADRVAPETEVVEGDVLREETLTRALEGVHTAYYMVHSMGSASQEELLALVKAANKSLIVFVQDRCFNGCTDARSPAYLRTDPAFHGGVEIMYRDKAKTIPKGSVVRLWDPAVTNRFIKLYRELGRRYDAEPALVGLSIGNGESAIAINKATAPGYSAQAYDTELRRMATEVHLALPRTVSFTGMNFIEGGVQQLDAIAAHLTTLGSSGIHHPDTHANMTSPGYPTARA